MSVVIVNSLSNAPKNLAIHRVPVVLLRPVVVVVAKLCQTLNNKDHHLSLNHHRVNRANHQARRHRLLAAHHRAKNKR
jgi:hypothetical protein